MTASQLSCSIKKKQKLYLWREEEDAFFPGVRRNLWDRGRLDVVGAFEVMKNRVAQVLSPSPHTAASTITFTRAAQ